MTKTTKTKMRTRTIGQWMIGGLSLIMWGGFGSPASGVLKVVTTTEDLAAITRAVGGEAVEVVSLSRGYQDPHFIEAKPSHLVKLNKADLFIQIGLELEVAWAPPLLSNARNGRIVPGREGFLETCEGCEIVDRLTGRVDRSQGDVHPQGNPHYWMDPENGRMMARAIAAKLKALRPGDSAGIEERLKSFERELSERLVRWQEWLRPYHGSKIVTYHRSWSNWAKRFGLEVVDFIEPKPGIPPSAAHIEQLIRTLSQRGVKAMVMEPYFDRKLPEKISRETGVPLVVVSPSVGGFPEVKTYFDVFEVGLKKLVEAMEKGGRP